MEFVYQIIGSYFKVMLCCKINFLTPCRDWFCITIWFSELEVHIHISIHPLGILQAFEYYPQPIELALGNPESKFSLVDLEDLPVHLSLYNFIFV
jgi:hypothetical protein